MGANSNYICDVLVVGSGAGGMATAIVAKKRGLRVLVVEKQPVFGGSTALSGGWMWVPCSPLAERAGIEDSKAEARRYLQYEAGNHFDARRIDAFLDNGPDMVRFFEAETDVKFNLGMIPDYHAESPGATSAGRPIGPQPFDARQLGDRAKLLAPPIRGMTFVGLMFGSGPDMRHFMNALKSGASFWYTAKRLAGYAVDLLTHGRNMKLFNGAALAARLHKTAMDIDIPVWLNAPVRDLIFENGEVRGAVVDKDGVETIVRTSRAVVLATGGFPHDLKRRKEVFPHQPDPEEHISMAPEGNAGDGIALAEAVGGRTDMSFPNVGSWMPVSRVPLKRGGSTKVLHIMDRGKPGMISVRSDGKRFANEGANYHDFGGEMVKDGRSREQKMYIIGDHKAVRTYGIGFAKPFPVPLGPYLKSGYLIKGNSIAELARNAGIDPAQLERTVSEFNDNARWGVDAEFGKGEKIYERFQGDATHGPNPCVGPLEHGPYYAVRMLPGDIGTFGGLKTDELGRVLKDNDRPVIGLHAVGNDMASIFGGAYPGGGATLGPAMTFGFIIGNYLASKDTAEMAAC